MKVSGLEIREALRQWALRRDAANKRFEEALTRYEDETKESPLEAETELILCEDAIAHLQTAQSYFNGQINVRVGTAEMKLTYAVKRVGGAARLEKLWHAQVKAKKVPAWESARTKRTKDQVKELSAMSIPEMVAQAQQASLFAGQVRSAVSWGTSQTLEIEFLKDEYLHPPGL